MGALTVRTVLVQLATVGGTVALARLLSPADYGIAAIAIAVQQFGYGLVEFGLPSAFIRRENAFLPADQRALTGFVFAISAGILVLAAVVAGVLSAIGIGNRAVLLVLVGLLALPPYALRLAPTVVLERRLAYRSIAIIEGVQAFVFYAFAIPAAAAGFGAYGLVGGLPVSVVAGFFTTGAVARWHRGMTWEPSRLRPYLRFGVQTSGAFLLGLGRDVAFVAILAAVGSQALAGFYSMAQRVMTIPLTVSLGVQRVALPSLSLGETGPARAENAGRAIPLLALAIGLPVALLAGTARPLISVVLGHRWLPAAAIVLGASAGLLLFGSVVVMLQALALSRGEGAKVLVATIINTVTALTGAAVVAASAVATLWVGVAVSAGYGALAVALIAASGVRAHRGAIRAGWIVVIVVATAVVTRFVAPGTDIRSFFVGCVVGLGTWLLLTLVSCRAELAVLLRLIRGAFKPSLPANADAQW